MPDIDNRFTRPAFYSDAPSASSGRVKSLTEQAIEEALRQGIGQQETTPVAEDDPKGLSPLSMGMLWGGAAADAGTTVHMLHGGNVHEANPLLGNDPSSLKLALAKAGSAGLSHYLLNRLAKRNEKSNHLANNVAKILGLLQGGIAVSNEMKGR